MAGTALMGMVFTISFIEGSPLDLPILLIAYFVPVIVYSYDHYRDIKTDKITNPDRAEYLEKKFAYYPFIIGTYISILVGLILFGGQSIVEIFAFTAIVVGGGLLYAVSFKKLTKYIPAYKNIYVSFEWAIAATLLLSMYNQQSATLITLLMFTFIFLKYFTNTIFCDLKDIETDRQKGLKTIPVLIGFDKTIIFLTVLSIITVVPLFYGVYHQVLPVWILLFVIFAVYDITYILLAYKNMIAIKWSKYTFIADIEIPLWPIVLVPLVRVCEVVV